jgi:hypothetical protein
MVVGNSPFENVGFISRSIEDVKKLVQMRQCTGQE